MPSRVLSGMKSCATGKIENPADIIAFDGLREAARAAGQKRQPIPACFII
jgi:hypothetical protein